jgi:hypothetical protein
MRKPLTIVAVIGLSLGLISVEVKMQKRSFSSFQLAFMLPSVRAMG